MEKQLEGKKNRLKRFDFLKQGELGGILFCAILAAWFLYGVLPISVYDIFTKPLVLLLCFLLVCCGIEILFWVFRFLLGAGKKSRIGFLAALVLVGLNAAFATNMQRLVSSFVIGFVIALAVDLFGRCIYDIFGKPKVREPVCYIITAISFCVIVSSGIFFHGSLFTENAKEQAEDIEKIFDETGKTDMYHYIQNGPYEVSVMDYGSTKDKELQTGTVDLSPYVSVKGITKFLHKLYFKQSVERTPVAGRIWYPKDKTDNPVVFIVHGNHAFTVESHLGYDYLGEYLASNGYVVVSVDENMLNELSGENGGRAILLLENIRTILEENEKEESPLYQRIDSDKIAIAGHSRGGEAVALAYELNQLDVYPDNGNLHLNYHFPITSVIAIAPCVDQYMPAGYSVKLTDVNYLLLHGSDDMDVTGVMGEKQYRNVTFSGNGAYEKGSVYIVGANHGQFNSLWGRYDLTGGLSGFLNTDDMISSEKQQCIAKVYIRAFLDQTFFGSGPYKAFMGQNQEADGFLPDTVKRISYQTSDFKSLCDFERDADITVGNTEDIKVYGSNVSLWKIQKDAYGSGGDEENHVLRLTWNSGTELPGVELSFPTTDISKETLSFRIADMREEEKLSPFSCSVTLYDRNHHKATVANPYLIQPSIARQLYKQDILTNQYEYKHQMETVSVPFDTFYKEEGFDEKQVTKLVISFSSEEAGNIILDDIGVYEYQK